MKKLKDIFFKNKIGFLAALTAMLVLALLAGLVSFAAYTTHGYKKGVVTTTHNEAPFSSNLLSQYASGSDPSGSPLSSLLLYFKQGETTFSKELYICNYPQGKPTRYAALNITYSLQLSLHSASGPLDLDAASYPRINGTPITPEGITLASSTLIGSSASRDSYSLAFPTNCIGKVYIKLRATPDAASWAASSNSFLYRELWPCYLSDTEALDFRCVGSFTDLGAGYESVNFHALNYALEVSNGTGRVRLSWDNTKLSLDPFFLEDMAAKGYTKSSSGATDSLEFDVDSQLIPFYELVFYRCGVIPNESWSVLSSLVSLTLVTPANP